MKNKTMKPAKKRWGRKEESILRKCVQDNPTNLNQTFMIISKKIGRTVPAIRQHYYRMTIDKENAMFTLASKRFMTVNRKCHGKKMRAKHNDRSFIHMFRQLITRFFNND